MHFVLITGLLYLFGQSALAKIPPPVAGDGALKSVVEVLLPPYQSAALLGDLAFTDLRFAGNQELMILGRTALWQWRFAEQTLRRLELLPKDLQQADSPWLALGADGSHLFVASKQDLLQVQWEQQRVFRYPLGQAGVIYGFSGSSDHFWLLQQAGLRQFDRYGRTLIPGPATPYLQPQDHVAYDVPHKLLWFARGTQLWRVDTATSQGSPKLVLTAKHRLLDLQLGGAGDAPVTHTGQALLRFTREGRAQRAIPVEGQRRLVAMSIGKSSHAYLFDDHLLEVFNVQSRQVQRYRLPFEESAQTGTMRYEGQYLALLVDGRPRLFHLDSSERNR